MIRSLIFENEAAGQSCVSSRSRIHHEHEPNQWVQPSRARVFFFFQKYPWPLWRCPRNFEPEQVTNQTRGGGRPFGRTAIISLPSHEAVRLFPFAARGETEKKIDSPLLCSPVTSAAVDGFRKDQIRRRRNTDARSDLLPVRSALLVHRHAVVPGAVGQRLQITGLREENIGGFLNWCGK